MRLGQWTPPIDISTSPAPGSGYTSSSWWKDPLSDLLEGATGAIEGALGLDDPAYPPPPMPEPYRATIVPPRLSGTVLLVAGVGLVWFLSRGLR